MEPAADLSVTKVGAPDPLRVGSDITYTLAVANSGPSTATSVTLTDELPASLTFQSASSSQGTCGEASGTVTCDLGTLAASSSATVQIVVRADSAGDVTNSAEVSAAEMDPDHSGNSATDTTTVEPVADLSITKSDSPDPATTGANLTYALEVANAGPSSASAVTVSDDLPASLAFQSATASQGTCSESSGAVTCELGTIDAASVATVQIVVRPQVAGEISNTATVSSAAHDPNEADNSASQSTRVDPPAAYPRPGGGTPFRVPLVPEYTECTPANQNSTHVQPLNAASCTPAGLQSSLLTTSTTGRGQASARLDVIVGNPSTAADEADFNIGFSATDVKVAANGSDYTGTVILATSMRITDRANTPGDDLAATVQDFDFAMPVDCVATPAPETGGRCSLTSSADSLVPGFVAERKRAVISAFSIRLLDAGADGSTVPAVDPFGLGCPPTCGSGDENVFLRQGVFTP